MDAQQLRKLLFFSGCYSDKKKTRNGLFAEVSWDNFDTDQVNNRLNAGWKTAQYIIVNDCSEGNLHKLLSKWTSLTSGYMDQYLLVFNRSQLHYVVYNSDGEKLGDDSILEELLGTIKKGYKGKWQYQNQCGSVAINKIFYGVPGCGKSHHIQHNILEQENYKPHNIIRTTFYQDYSNTDFVGQILPKVVKGENGEKDTVEYIFNPGPFTLAFVQAIRHPSEKVALVIEEINRGNAPAIFGDIFQLLDRTDTGISEYGIKNVGITDYLESINFGTEDSPLRYNFENIKIPGNMFIYATMNTSDQNVYTFDTAFTRRWQKECISNNFNKNPYKDYRVPGMQDYSWQQFADAINGQIKQNLDTLQVNEDKQIGIFFVKATDLQQNPGPSPEGKRKQFAYKVLEYLWNDVSKLDHSVIFDSTYTTFEAVVDAFVEKGKNVFNGNIDFDNIRR